MARVPLLEAADLPEEYRYLFTENDVGDAHIFRAMANAPELMQWYMRYSTRLWDVLPERERDRHPRDRSRPRAPYEWHQHVRLGRAAGVTDAEITAITDGDLAALDDRDGALVAYARGVALGDPAMRITTGFERTTTSGPSSASPCSSATTSPRRERWTPSTSNPKRRSSAGRRRPRSPRPSRWPGYRRSSARGRRSRLPLRSCRGATVDEPQSVFHCSRTPEQR